MTLVPHPGFVSPSWLNVQECLRQRHDEVRASVAEAIKQREAKQIPLDDRADWRAEVSRLCADAASRAKRDEVAEVLAQALGVAHGGLRQIAEYKPDPALDGVEVKVRALSKADMLELEATLAAAGYDGEDEAKRYQSQADTHRAARPFLLKSIASVRGVLVEDGTFSADVVDDAAIDRLDACGLLPALFEIARHYNRLSPFLRRAFGSSPPSTSLSSSAESAHRSDERSSDAKAADSSSRERTSPPTSAPRDTSAMTVAGPFDEHSISIAHAEGSQG